MFAFKMCWPYAASAQTMVAELFRDVPLFPGRHVVPAPLRAFIDFVKALRVPADMVGVDLRADDHVHLFRFDANRSETVKEVGVQMGKSRKLRAVAVVADTGIN